MLLFKQFECGCTTCGNQQTVVITKDSRKCTNIYRFIIDYQNQRSLHSTHFNSNSRITSYNVCYTKLLRELTLTYQQERYDNRVNFINKKSYSWAIVSEDSQTGTITKQIDFTGTFVSSTHGTVSTSGWLSKEGNTLYYLAGTGGEKLFYVDFDDNTYLDSAQYATDDKLVLVGSNGRITSYNVCYTKLLRAVSADISS